eukprot:SAG11_NODE_7786_length_1096_cov_2.420261_3_plen_52_part_00
MSHRLQLTQLAMAYACSLQLQQLQLQLQLLLHASAWRCMQLLYVNRRDLNI